jgi:hypothetical protein
MIEALQLMMSEISRAKALGNQGLDVRLEGLSPPKQALRHARHKNLPQRWQCRLGSQCQARML